MYQEFYHLKGKPFQLSADARFFFNSSAHNRAMAYLRYGVKQGEGFIVITGGIGTGKTMLVRNLFRELNPAQVNAAQLVSTQLNADDLLRMVAASYQLEHEDISKTQLLKNLEDFFLQQFKAGKRNLIVVDEAQNLPLQSIEELRMLSNFQVEGRALVQSFLLGQNELKRKLGATTMEQFRQRIIAGYHLRALDVSELSNYVEHRLMHVGWKNDPIFSAETFQAIYDATQGVPRKINTLCDRLMLFGCLEELHELKVEHVNLVADEIRDEFSDDPLDDEPTALPVVSTAASNELLSRLTVLEKELSDLKAQAKKDRMLVKKAIILNLEMDEDEDDE